MSNGHGDLPPAGWYPDPEQPGQQRWWDGQQWTEHRAPLTPGGGASAQPSSSDTEGGVPGWEVRQPPASGDTGGGWGASDATGSPGWTSAGPSAGGWGGGAPPEIKPWLWQPIVATLLCCLPAGIVGIVFAAQARSAINARDWSTAEQKAAKARTWTLVSVVLGLIAIPIIAVMEFGAMGGFR